MAKVKFTVKENNAVGRHSFYASFVPTGTLTFDDAVKFACKGTDIEESAMRRDITEFMKTVQDFVLMGYRVSMGEQFLTVYPVIQCSAKDVLNPDKTVKKAATADMVDGRKATGRLGASVSTKFSKRFDMEVSWVKTDKGGNEIADETDITQNNDGPTDTGDDSSDSSDNGGGNGQGGDGWE